MKTIILIVISFLPLIMPCSNDEKENSLQEDYLLNYNIISGKGSQELYDCLNNIVIQRLLLDISSEPGSEDFIRESLKNTSLTFDQFMNFNLVRKNADLYVINILLLTKEDQYKLRELTESHAKILADKILDHRAEIEQLVSGYQVEVVDPHAVLYMILGCFSLDWDGLALTEEKGLRNSRMHNNKKPVVLAWEPTELTKRNIYCGSHNSIYRGIEFTSFGDHENQPREILPDVFWNPSQYNDQISSNISTLKEHSSINRIATKTGIVLLNLRTGPKSMEELVTGTDVDNERIDGIIDLLLTLGYIAQKGEKYYLTIPVLSETDFLLVKELRRIGWEEMESWLDSDYPRLRSDLSTLTPFRFGQKQEDLFYNVWHDIFGAANRILVESGLFADPYSKQYGGKGYIPVVFKASLYSKNR